MKNKSALMSLQYLIARDQRFVCTIVSYMAILLIFINLSLTHSPAIGIVASAIFFLINAIFLGHALFEKENAFLRFMLGALLQIVILGLVAWAVMILYSLDNIGSAIVLIVTSSFASFLNRKVKSKNVV